MKKSIKFLAENVVKVDDAINACKNFASCQFGHGFIARSTYKPRAPKATAAEWMMQFGSSMPSIIKVTLGYNIRAYNYAAAVNRALTKAGKAAEFESASLNGYSWVVPNIIKRADHDGSLQFCVTFKVNDADKTTFESKYIVNDHLATAEEEKFLKEHLYVAPSKSAKQEAAGVNEEDVVMVRNYKFSNLVAVGKTDEVRKMWKELTE